MMQMLEKILPQRWAGSFRLLRDHLKTPLYANAYLLIVNQGLSAVLGMLYWVAAAHIFSTELTGEGSAIISTLGYVSALAELSLKSGMQRFVPLAGRHVRKLILLTYGTVILVSAILMVIFLTAGDALNISENLLRGFNQNTILFYGLATICYTVFIIQDGVLMGLRQTLWVLLENTLFNVTKVILLFAGLSSLLGNGIAASWFVPAPVIVIIVNLLIFFRFIPAYLRTHPQLSNTINPRLVVKSVGGDHVGTILSETSFRLLPLMIINLLGTSANAYFYQAWLIGSMLYLISANVSSSFTVEAASNPERIGVYSRQSLRHSLTLAVPMMLVLAAAAPLILRIYGGAYASEGAPLLRWLALAAVPYAVNAWFLAYSRVKANVKAIIFTQALQCAVTLGLSYLWMPEYGIASIGLAWLLAQLAVSGMVVVMTRNVLFAQKAALAPVPVSGFQAEGPGVQPAAELALADPDKELYLVLSPHLDDGVLSCGGYLAKLVQSGERVVIASFFTQDPPKGEPLSWLAQRNLHAWNMSGSPDAFAQRRTEDQAAAARLGVETLYLGLQDAMFRCGPDGRFTYQKNTVGVPVEPDDERETGRALRELMRGLQERFSGYKRLTVLAPLGMSLHVDHLLVRDQAQAVFGVDNLLFYEEQPYVGRDEHWSLPEMPAASSLSWEAETISLSQPDIEAWKDATACYISQVPGLFPKPLERTLEILYTRTPGVLKPLWELQDRAIQPTDLAERVAGFIQQYIQKTGGMKLWYLVDSVPGGRSEVETIEAHH